MLCAPREYGQGMVEYAFIFLLMALVVVVVLSIFGPTIGNVFTDMSSRLSSY
jgi:Flp pilus assembly pilin Flp